MTAPLSSPTAGEVLPASTLARPGCPPSAGKAGADRRPADLGPVIHISASGCRYHADSIDAARARAIHALLQVARGQESARERMAERAERWAADVAQARAVEVEHELTVMPKWQARTELT